MPFLLSFNAMRSILATLLICCGILAALSAPAEDKAPPQDKPPRPKTDLGFDATKVPPPDPKKGKPVARVLDQYLYLDDFGGKLPADNPDARLKLQGLVSPLFKRFIEREKIVATPAEIDQAVQLMQETKEEFLANGIVRELSAQENKEVEAAIKEVAEALVVQWKYGRALYERYGGTVIFQQGNPLEPVGAYLAFLEEAERAGAFEVYDADDRNAFYEYFTRKHPFVVPPDSVDYEKPWWVRAKERETSK